MKRHSFFTAGFTLIEILVVVAIIGLLAGTVTFFALSGSQTSRDAKRQSDLRLLQAAVEQYKRENGHYPAGCRGAGNWSGEPGTAFACPPGANNQYIDGLAPTYISRLPRDPRRGDCTGECGYVYVSNYDPGSTAEGNGSVYKIMAMNTVEITPVTYSHPLKSCDVTSVPNNNINIAGLCGRDCGNDPFCGSVTNVWSNAAHRCSANNSRFQRSYGVWGGYAPLHATARNPARCGNNSFCVDELDPLNKFVGGTGSETPGVQNTVRMRAVYDTTQVICR